jgi:hypothetical protein
LVIPEQLAISLAAFRSGSPTVTKFSTQMDRAGALTRIVSGDGGPGRQQTAR